MKKELLVLLVTVTIFNASMVTGQENINLKGAKSSTTVNPNFAKGKMQIGIEGLSFGWGYGRVSANIGLRYGYFVANNSLLFVNGEVGTWGNEMQTYKLGLHFRKYFTKNKLQPYVQLGTNTGLNNFFNNDIDMYGEISIGGGVSYQIGKFNFEMGMQLNIWDKANFKPTIGVSYTF